MYSAPVERMNRQAIEGSMCDETGDLRVDVERVSTRLNRMNQMTTGNNMNDWMQSMQSFGEEFAIMEPKLTFISKSVRDELLHIKKQEEGELRERFGQQMDEYRKAQDKLKQLEDTHDEHAQNSAHLSDDLNSITEELDQRKKQIDLKVNSVTDANPLVEIRAAIQRLRKENRELDIHIGMLDYELTVARYQQRSSSSHNDNEIEDEIDQNE